MSVFLKIKFLKTLGSLEKKNISLILKMGRPRINGTRRQVYNGTMPKTKTGLLKDDLMQRMDAEGNPYGSIISVKKHLKGLEQRSRFNKWREANMSRVIANQFKKGQGKIEKGAKLNRYTPKMKEASPEKLTMLPPPPMMTRKQRAAFEAASAAAASMASPALRRSSRNKGGRSRRRR